MGLRAPDIDITTEPRALKRALGKYRLSRLARSIVELMATLIPFVSLSILMWGTLNAGH